MSSLTRAERLRLIRLSCRLSRALGFDAPQKPDPQTGTFTAGSPVTARALRAAGWGRVAQPDAYAQKKQALIAALRRPRYSSR